MSSLNGFLSMCTTPVFKPIKKAYRSYRDNSKVARDLFDGYDLSIPKLTDNQKKELDSLYGRYGFCIKSYYNYYRFLSAANGVFSPEFMFSRFVNKEIMPRFNNPKMEPAWSDKCYLDLILPEVRVPCTILRNINGHFFDNDFRPIDDQSAEKIFDNHNGALIVKPSILSGGGKSISLHKNPSEAVKVFDTYKRNFVVQRVVEQHPVLSELNPSSLNTLRIASFNFKGATHILLSGLRVGAETSCVDNLSSGGVAFSINNRGEVVPIARDGWGWPTYHPKSETIIKNKTVIPSYDEIIDIVKEQHLRFPHFGLIAWDFAVDCNGCPIVVEINLRGFSAQPFQEAAGRPLFGDMTEEVLKETSRRDFL